MGHAANKAKERTCKDCKQSIYGNAAAIKRHAQMCVRLSRLNLVVPGLLTGQAAYDELAKHRPGRR